MFQRIKLLAVAAAAACCLFAAVGVATAAELTIANAGVVNLVGSGKTTFTWGGTTVACNLTLELELAAGPIAKTAGTSVGSVRGVRWANCEGTTIAAVLELPWDVQYGSISGTLPEGITSMQIVIKNFAFRWTLFGGFTDCLYAGDVGLIVPTSRIRTSTNRYTTGSSRLDETSTLRLASGGFGCPSEGSWRGVFNFSSTQTLTRT